jgi:hypothetical protein
MSEKAVVVITATERMEATRRDGYAMEMVGQRVMGGETLREIARSQGLPVMAFVEWVTGDPERLAVYEAALRVRGGELANEVVRVADDEGLAPAQVANRLKARMWLASKLDAERYGERGGVRASARVVVDRRAGSDGVTAAEVVV